MIWSFILFVGLASAQDCKVHAVKALQNPALVPLKESKAPKATGQVAVLAKEFGILLAAICAGKPCGSDPQIDQMSREQINIWIKKAEKLKEAEQKVLKTVIRDWIRVEILYLTKEGWDKNQVELRKSRIEFFDARFAERKSPFRDLFCLE